MNTLVKKNLSSPLASIEADFSKHEKLLSYYETAGPDYQAWSPNYNMHFGYFKKGMNPFNRELMLQEMNKQVLAQLGIPSERPVTLVDLGCGLAATARYACKQYPNLSCKGITIVPWQKEKADLLNTNAGLHQRIDIQIADYVATGLPDASVDYVIAMESSCYANGAEKADLLREIQRILKPGGRMVIVDGFVHSDRKKGRLLQKAYNQLCRSWALTELGDIRKMTRKLNQLKFESLTVKDISWRVAPSVAHVPFTVLKFLVKQFFFGTVPMKKERWDNLKSPLLTMVLGLHRKHFSYYLVQASKPQM